MMIHSSLTGYLFEIESYSSCKCAQNVEFDILCTLHNTDEKFLLFFNKKLKETSTLDLSIIDIVSTYLLHYLQCYLTTATTFSGYCTCLRIVRSTCLMTNPIPTTLIMLNANRHLKITNNK